MPILIGVVTSGDYLAKGPAIPAEELKAKGGMTRVIPLRTIWNDNLAADYKAQYRSFEAWLGALVKDGSAFNPSTHLNKGSTIPGQYATAWWAPRGAQQGNTMAELIGELALNPSTYEGGCVRATVGPDAAQMAGFKKPTALDGIFFAEFVPAPSSPWGITGGGSLEAVAPKIALSQTTQLEFLPGNMAGADLDDELTVASKSFGMNAFSRQEFQNLVDITQSKALNILNNGIEQDKLFKVGGGAKTQYTFDKDYKENIPDTSKPYANPQNRPSYASGQVEQVWKNAKTTDGKVYDPFTGEELTWDRTKSRAGQWDMGHKPGHEYKKLHQDYMDDVIDYDTFLKEYRDPNNYFPQSVSSNRSRQFEL